MLQAVGGQSSPLIYRLLSEQPASASYGRCRWLHRPDRVALEADCIGYCCPGAEAVANAYRDARGKLMLSAEKKSH
jgi:hypothetical protein